MSSDQPTHNVVIHDQLFYEQPLYNSRIEKFVWECQGLEYIDRVILSSVFRHIPRPAPGSPQGTIASNPTTTQIIERIMILPVNMLELLANLCYVALAEAHEWRGASEISLTPPPYPRGGHLETYQPLFAALGIAIVPTITSHPRPAGYGDTTKNSFVRHLDRCPITYAETALEHIQILPFSLLSLHTDGETPFWMFLAICLGPAARDLVFSVIDYNEAEQSTLNSLILRSDLQINYASGLFHLSPLLHNFEASTCRQYDVRFYWHGTGPQLATCLTTAHKASQDQVAVASLYPVNGHPMLIHTLDGPARKMETGDRYTLFTNDPVRYPLPHPLLLRIHGMLARMIRSIDLMEIKYEKRYLYSETSDSEGSDDDDDDDDDDAQSEVTASELGSSDKTGGSTPKESEALSGFDSGDQQGSERGADHHCCPRCELAKLVANNAFGTSTESTGTLSAGGSNWSPKTLRSRSISPPRSQDDSQPVVRADMVFNTAHLAYLDLQLTRHQARCIASGQYSDDKRTQKERKSQWTMESTE